MKVLKFGGTSVGTVESLRNVKYIIESNREPVIAVVSALGGLTDKLISTAYKAASGDSGFCDDMDGIRLRHKNIIDGVVAESRRKKVEDTIFPMLDELENMYKGISLIHDVPVKVLDRVVSFGERMSSVIVANMLDNATHRDSLTIVKTEKWFSKDIADRKLTESLIKKEFSLPLETTAIMGGFISTDRETGEITNLGRGGSDYTAALVAAALNAEVLEIWTDVDGFMTADPRIIPSARIIPFMSFVESMELCSFGAKVIYPPTIYPVFYKNIPIKILNTFNPEAPGTLITECPQGGQVGVRGISSMKSTSMITISGTLAENLTEINSRAFNSLARRGVNILMVANNVSLVPQFSFVIASCDSNEAVACLKEEFAPELHNNRIESVALTISRSIIAIVGEGIKEIKGLSGVIESLLKANSVEVAAAAESSVETTMTFVVADNDVEKALRIVHEWCFDKNCGL